MKIEHCRHYTEDGHSLRRLMILIDETELITNKDYKRTVYNDIFDVIEDTFESLMEEYKKAR